MLIRASAGTDLPFCWLGRQPYRLAWARFRERAGEVASGKGQEIIWACEHDPVYTTGHRGADNRLAGALGAPFVRTDRGGETTFHGPGQLVLYPVIHLRRRGIGIRDYVFLFEQSCLDLLEGLGLRAGRKPHLPGIWIDDAKLASIGLRVSRGVVYHGMSLNVSVALPWFEAIRACGTSLPVTNMGSHLRDIPDLPELAGMWAGRFRHLLEMAVFPFTAL